MKLTRYYQSCLIVEEDGVRLLIDASVQEIERIEQFGHIDAVLFTHEHSDHFSSELAEKYRQIGVPIYANDSTAKNMISPPNIMVSGQEFEVKGVKIKPIDLPHCLLFDGRSGPQNTALLINNKFLDSGDSVEITSLTAEIAAIPMVGPDVSFKDSIAYAKSLQAKVIVPLHYDYLGGNPEVFSEVLARVNSGQQVRPLQLGETVQL